MLTRQLSLTKLVSFQDTLAKNSAKFGFLKGKQRNLTGCLTKKIGRTTSHSDDRSTILGVKNST